MKGVFLYQPPRQQNSKSVDQGHLCFSAYLMYWYVLQVILIIEEKH